MKILLSKVGIRKIINYMKFSVCLFKFWTLPYGSKVLKPFIWHTSNPGANS